MLGDVLMYAWIWVGSDLVKDEGAGAFETPKAKKALQIISDLAASDRAHKQLVEYFWFNAYSVDWLKTAAPHLPSTVLSDLVLRGDPEGLCGGEPTVGDLIAQHACDETRTAIAKGAAESGRLMEMLKKTNWHECRQQGQGAMRDTIIAYDLGL
ncbi:hypothetical protein PLA107_031165 (plasmid) [Pseudomonas amygdali pv. lachrymans str. M301315]|uniref:Uncharacterized protein n=3 Tax=Pseudomonas amygdali TaxID=47877 RepID=A0ABR5KTV1_PSEAV|nr:hypothetical protein PLA107_031165 [Pseudomonas amygdali pv. lachrymans str. M301315]KPC17110.1 Uncharacterized protein AC499_0312 [Pseudomonas amygdali pv. lachrymans]KPC18069.1 Uncharacterized protein AC499_1271 [Pseudomonas amygdali pv. lachrymans]